MEDVRVAAGVRVEVVRVEVVRAAVVVAELEAAAPAEAMAGADTAERVDAGSTLQTDRD